jgi:hypothetical protein
VQFVTVCFPVPSKEAAPVYPVLTKHLIKSQLMTVIAPEESWFKAPPPESELHDSNRLLNKEATEDPVMFILAVDMF